MRISAHILLPPLQAPIFSPAWYGSDAAANNSAYGSTPGDYKPHGYTLAYPAGTPVDLVVTSPHPITVNHPEIYKYKGYVTSVAGQPVRGDRWR